MSVKLKRSSRKAQPSQRTAAPKLDRPIERTVLGRARQIASGYQIILQYEDSTYFGRALEMPYVMSDGRTPNACVQNTLVALTTAVAALLERGESPPSSAAEHRTAVLRRTEQINIRLTREEKLLLEQSARAKGFRGLGDFIRTTTLARSTA